MTTTETLRQKYPGALAWSFGDSPELADRLLRLVINGKKTVSCGSFSVFAQEEEVPAVGSYSIILDGQGNPACVIRTVAMWLMRFCDVSEEMAAREGEGDLSLNYWRTEHQRFFSQQGTFAPDMELVFEAFTLVEVV